MVPLILSILAILIPLMILRPFSRGAKLLVILIIALHLSVMVFLHYRLIQQTGQTIIYDVHDDEQQYWNETERFSSQPPFSITIPQIMEATGGSSHFGYQYMLGTLRTITPDPMLGMRLLKVMLYFIGLSCLARVWLRDYGQKLALWGFVFLSIIFTPIFFYNFRNFKDSIIVSLFMLVMAMLDTILRPREQNLRPMGIYKTYFAWAVLLILLFITSTIRIYTSAIVVIAVIMHIITTSRMDVRARVTLALALVVTVVIGFRIGMVSRMMELSGETLGGQGIRTALSLRGVLQAFFSPIPWGAIWAMEPFSAPFYWIYWLLLPYALYTMIRHPRMNINWKLFVYVMILYVVGVAIGDPPRKRLIVYPILVAWVLGHLAYKQFRRQQAYESQAASEQDTIDEYSKEQLQTM
jgi:hypothetical protein